MAPYHNNKLNMVGLFDEEDLAVPNLTQQPSMSTYGSTTEFANRTYNAAMDPFNTSSGNGPAYRVQMGGDAINAVSYSPTYDSDYAESDQEDRRPSKIPKINKDGVPRKPRQPRPKLLKWSDDDWKNVVLGIIWACGETGVQIPFDQAAQVVGENCTAGALQQAVLKLRGKQVSEGFQIPSLRMAWTRKNKNATLSSSGANDATEQGPSVNATSKKSTRMKGNQSLIVTLKHAYPHTDRVRVVRDSRKKKHPVSMIPAEHPFPCSMSPKLYAQPSGESPAYMTATPPVLAFGGECHEANSVEYSVQKHLDEHIPAAFEYTNTLGQSDNDTDPLLDPAWCPEVDQGYNQGNNQGIDTLTEDGEVYHDALEHQPVGCVGGFLSDMPNGFAYNPVYSHDLGTLQDHRQQAPPHLDDGHYPGFPSHDLFANGNFGQGSLADVFKTEVFNMDIDTSHFN